MPTCSSQYPAAITPGNRLPRIQPVELVARSEPFDDPDWVFEPKYDGVRGFVYGSGSGCEIRSALDLSLDGLSGLAERVAGVLGNRSVILDGEVVSLDRQGKPNLGELIRGQGFLAFAAFDLLWLDGSDLRDQPLSRRKAALAGLLPEDTGPLYKILTLDEYGRALFSAIRKMDLAGVVAKRKQDAYGASATWYRIGNPGYQPAGRRAVVSARSSASAALRPG